jgi:hypothetical protein
MLNKARRESIVVVVVVVAVIVNEYTTRLLMCNAQDSSDRLSFDIDIKIE